MTFGDPTVLPDLLNQIGTPVSRFIADGAYDGAPTSDLLKARFGEAVVIIIPPPKNAIPSPQSKCFPSLRDRHIVKIQTHGRMAWQSGSGYNQRSRIETQMGRWKAIIGPKLKARCFENQQTEAKNRRRHSQQNDRTRPTRVQTNLIACITGKGGFATIV